MIWRRLLYAITALVFLAMAMPSRAQDGKPGIGVDSRGGQVVDPTKNVLDLVEALKEMLKELRAADKEIADLRYATLKENEAIRSDYDDRLRKAEAGRLDALRLFDTNNVAVATATATAQATALAKKSDDSALVLQSQGTKNADDLRTLVKTTADEQTRNLQQQFSGIQAQFTALGTQFTVIGTRLSSLEQGSVNSSGIGAGRSDVAGWAQTAVMMLVAIGMLVVTFMTRKTAR